MLVRLDSFGTTVPEIRALLVRHRVLLVDNLLALLELLLARAALVPYCDAERKSVSRTDQGARDRQTWTDRA